MKKQVKNEPFSKRFPKKSKVFNSINIILAVLLIAELILVGNWITTGNPIRTLEKASISEDKGTTGTTSSSSLGALVTKEGKVELIIQDNFEKPELSKELYYLNENGKRYLLSTNTRLPVSAKIRVTGYLKDNVLSFSNSQTKSASLQGTSYAVTSTTIEPWPPTLGEQRYAVVYLFRENETQYDVENLTNITFGLANDWITETSYGKASVSYGYVGSFILNESFFNESLCDSSGHGGYIFDYAIQKIDPFVDFSQYGGVIVYHPNTPCTDSYVGWTASLKSEAGTQEGIVKLYKTIMNRGYLNDQISPFEIYVLVHEMGHGFGMGHASLLLCNQANIEKTLSGDCTFWEYGDLYETMGSGLYKHQGLKHKIVFTGWIDENESIETTGGTYFIKPILSEEFSNSGVKGLRIPISWDTGQVMIRYSPTFSNTFDNEGSTHYYLEYRTSEGFDSFYNPIKGVLLRLGRNDPYYYDDFGNPIGYWMGNTYLLNLHPGNSTLGDCSQGCYSYAYVYLEENQTYVDSFNKMNITVLDMNKSGALVKITRWEDPTCTDTDGGNVADVKGTASVTSALGTLTFTDYCSSTTSLKEYYCNNNQAVLTTYSCTDTGCSNGVCPRSTTKCYYDKILRRKVCNKGGPIEA